MQQLLHQWFIGKGSELEGISLQFENVSLIMKHKVSDQQAQIGNHSCPGNLETIMDWPEGKAFWILPEEEVTHAEEAL